MTLHDELCAGANAVLQEVDGETVTYTPAGSTARAVVAIVTRGAWRSDGLPLPGPGISIAISQADVPTVVLNGDTVAVKLRPTDVTTATLRVTEFEPAGQSGGMWRLVLG